MYIFLLGGMDLEMKVIRLLLESAGMIENQSLFDRGLSWSNARLDEYQDVMTPGRDEYIGVELREENFVPPQGAKLRLIDHHNEHDVRPSSLEQIADLLGIALNREQQLIAANDKGYIPAMIKLGATPEEVQHIRMLDRRAQGITEEEETLGEQSLDRLTVLPNGWMVVDALTSRFATVRDRLPVEATCVIFHYPQLMYTGPNCKRLIQSFRKDFEQLGDDILKTVLVSGGGDNGYLLFFLDRFPHPFSPQDLIHRLTSYE